MSAITTEAAGPDPVLLQSIPPRTRAQWAVFAILLALACGWILSLPVFPSQDGPVHVYYAHVSRDLLLGGHTYTQDYRIARPFPPYAIHAYTLMALLGFTSGEMAEKLLACLCVLVSGIGVASFAKQLGRSAAIASAVAVPFLLNRYLFLGFYGYILGVGFALMTMAVWLRPDRARPSLRAAFVALTILTLFAHPVPYLLVVAFCWTEIGAGWWNRWRRIDRGIAAPGRADVFFAAIATSFFLYIAHYSHSGSLWNNELLVNVDLRLLRIVNVLHMSDVLPVTARSARWVMTVVLGAAIVISSLRAMRDSDQPAKPTPGLSGAPGAGAAITKTQLVVGWALLILVGLPVLPRTMNGSGFFSERFAILPPLLFVAALSAAEFEVKVRKAVLVAAAAVCVYAIVLLNTYIAPYARAVDVSFVRPDELAGQHLLWRVEPWRSMTINFDPLILGDIRLVDRGGALLLDNPWMDLQIMMLEETGPKVHFDPENGPRVVSGPQVKVGAISARCALTRGESSLEHVARRHPEQWQLKQYACFEVLAPR